MQMLIYILVVVAFFVIAELIPAIKAKQTKYVCIYCAMITSVLVIWVLLSKGVALPGPNEPIKAAIEFIVGPLE